MDENLFVYVKEIRETNNVHEVNLLLKDNWILLDFGYDDEFHYLLGRISK